MNLKKFALAGGALAVLATAGSVANAKVVDKPKFKVGGLVLVWGGTSADADATVVSDFYLLTGSSSTDLIGGSANDVNGGAETVVTGTFDVIATNGTTNPAADGEVTEGSGGEAGVLDATDTLNAFAIDNNTDLANVAGVAKGKFFVASNTGFQIKALATLDAVASTPGMTLANVKYDLAMDASSGTTGAVNWGGNSQDPCLTSVLPACGVQASVERLSDMSTEATVFTGPLKTAATRGSIADQSIRFDTTYEFDSDGVAGTDDGYDLSDGTFNLEAEVVYTVYAP